MAISPPQVTGLTRSVTNIYAEAEYQLVQLVAQYTAKGIETPRWAAQQLDEIYLFRSAAEDLMRTVQAKSGAAVRHSVYQAARVGQETASGEVARVLRREVAPIARDLGVITRTPTRAIANLALETQNNLNRTHPRILRAVQDDYRMIISRVTGNVLTGVHTQKEALQSALDQFAERGITGFTDAAGRHWSISSYAEMSMRTANTTALVNAHTQELLDEGHKYVIVSDNPQECAKCRPYEGKILSIDGSGGGGGKVEGVNQLTGRIMKFEVLASLAEARSAGLYHPNCRHSHKLYMPGITEPPEDTADPAGEADREKLRYLERQVRAAKLRQAAAIDSAGQREAKTDVSRWNAAIKQHTDTTSAKRQRDRENPKTGNAANVSYRA
jgi:hypothetical protein